ncbi:glyoxalase/bleomycin resistance/dioxygenase family protein [Vibrio parahaemolyticus]|uniref:glyoxalase/bleomycin resistance/dioxygenase family protein n=1 Tax=Vibrio parahaemolyticus TaxID=670 RepID=UPI0003FA6ECC|nr:glyoxalase/bleomycin resistance/dioxygenase family protein [Vibrio parahaemolyticus]EKA7375353.1 glyoxalase/bleomycin resistance/dioxygenase family protein [Vibrio parahaemolyticus]ELA9378177.1 glyoxalase/bleomycin resistance/dioxygenase family protein [Vibrio parahaemolyticus]ELK8488260.1 glyoxalase/bleomycin resistance/dioxygenase family protein [Vibrio parahaemolyticus]MDF4355257.1 glyoxalase/bleomycin resistance/dioxygenase family protein [Vibrio parahaemolyticus]HCG6066004.1 glyoxalase
MKPIAILIHVPNVEKGLAWYQNAFPSAKPIYHPDSDFTVLELEGFSIEIVQADSKVGVGKNGTVLYWSVVELETSLQHFQSLGAKLYRGPMAIENGLIMCQLEDPFGNLIGLRSTVT